MTPNPATADRAGELRELGDALTRLAEALLARGVPLQDAKDAFELRFLKAAVHRHGGNLSQAATELGIHRNTLRSKLQRNGGRAR
ncbi:MAG TPA: helix-turn-helix domain-containing protein [Thermoanaerobaculaceae bacterium]|nr:helix-turn-helix domain-containing protein [Thermoanaerobaculaceae bacterium]HPS77565.1 helix-turn-helix domain-containing protein [Thermoanaerobaculaceae bacterium]